MHYYSLCIFTLCILQQMGQKKYILPQVQLAPTNTQM